MSPVFPASDVTWFGDDDLQALRALGSRRVIPAGSTLFSEGDEPYDVALIESGEIKLIRVAANGQEIVLDVPGPGEMIGELSAIDGSPRSAAAVAISRVEFTSIPVDRFLGYLQEHPPSMAALLGVVVSRLRDANTRRLEASTADALGQVCARLDEMALRFGTDLGDGTIRIDLALNQTELAQWCGLSREAVVKALRKLRNLGWLTTVDGNFVVANRTEIRQRAQL